VRGQLLTSTLGVVVHGSLLGEVGHTGRGPAQAAEDARPGGTDHGGNSG
jgi:hypothetical protein